jgi:hypothetical protein
LKYPFQDYINPQFLEKIAYHSFSMGLYLRLLGNDLGVTDDKTTFRRMVIGFTIICICCGIMHVIMVKRGNLYLERSKPRYNLEKKDTEHTMLEGVGTIEGEVGAVGVERFFLLMDDDRLQPMLVGDVKMPKVGTVVKVTYTGGTPPKALMIEKGAELEAKP